MSKRRELVGEVPKVYSIIKGEVASVQPYGVFVKIPGCSKNGLVHRSQMSSTVVEKPEEILSVGEKIFCKVLSAEPDGTKIALSMKVVSQTTGKDLDPGNVQAAFDEKSKKSFSSRDVTPIELGAILDTTCRKCGGKGHLAQDCFHRPGDQAYELLDDDILPTAAAAAAGRNTQQETDKHRHKKDKKHKKKKKKDKSMTSEAASKHTKKHKEKRKSEQDDWTKNKKSRLDNSPETSYGKKLETKR